MDAKTLGNTPAFPCGADGGCGPWPGMTLREWYIGEAIRCSFGQDEYGDIDYQYGASVAARIADALLDELAKEHA